MDNKTDLRLRAKSIRKTLDIRLMSDNAVKYIRQFNLYKRAQNILIFYPKAYEINVLELLNDSKNFYLPKVCGNDLLVCPYCDKLETSEFNICEPCSNPVDASVIELAVIPALMGDKDGYRLGYGGGFYDRFLAANPHIKTILPLAKELIVENLPHESFDIKADYVIEC